MYFYACPKYGKQESQMHVKLDTRNIDDNMKCKHCNKCLEHVSGFVNATLSGSFATFTVNQIIFPVMLTRP